MWLLNYKQCKHLFLLVLQCVGSIDLLLSAAINNVIKFRSYFIYIGKATPNKLVDAHPIFMKKWGGWEVFIFYFLFFTPSVDIVKHLPVLHVKWK